MYNTVLARVFFHSCRNGHPTRKLTQKSGNNSFYNGRPICYYEVVDHQKQVSHDSDLMCLP